MRDFSCRSNTIPTYLNCIVIDTKYSEGLNVDMKYRNFMWLLYTNLCDYFTHHLTLPLYTICNTTTAPPQVDANMERSQRQDAVLKERFWFRQDILSRDTDKGDDSTEMTCDEIINGKVGGGCGGGRERNKYMVSFYAFHLCIYIYIFI